MDSDRDSCGIPETNHQNPASIRNPSAPPSVPTTTTYLRPTTQRTARRRAPPHSKDRFEAEVLGGKLWHRACQEISRDDFNGRIPMEFPSIDEYIATLDPLVLEEAREGLKSDWAESCAAGRTFRVAILSVDERAEGWAYVRVKIQGAREQAGLQTFNSNNTVAVLTMGQPPQRSPVEWISGKSSKVEDGAARPIKRSRVDQLKEQQQEEEQGEAKTRTAAAREATPVSTTAAAEGAAPEEGDATITAARVVAGLCIRGAGGGGYRGGGGGGGQELTIKIHPCCCRNHASKDTSPCNGILHALRRFPSAWYITPAGMLVTSEREFDAVHAVRSVDSDLMKHMLQPKLLAKIGEYYDNERRRKMWPQQAGQREFVTYLQSQYDHKQLEAIEMAACHLGGPIASSTETTSSQLPRDPKSAKPPAAPPSSSPPPKLSFVLIQGPPGTGKTHTVRGVLNVWHLVAFQRYYESLVQFVLPRRVNQRSSAGPSAYNQFDMLRNSSTGRARNTKGSNSKEHTSSARLDATLQATKPRILICTPSNAACDELMARVMSLGFCDGAGNIYRPNIVRVGADDSVVAPAVRERSLRSLVARYRDMSQPEWQRRVGDTASKMAQAENEVAALEASLERSNPGREANVIARQLVDKVQAAQRLRREVERLEAAKDLVWGGGGGAGGAGGAGGSGAGAGAGPFAAGPSRDQGKARRAETKLEEFILSEAEMVFATLSSTQRKVFKAVAAKAPFRTVLIDEAGQSSEVAALQPLAFGAKQVVLVGDPQQLPATILSEAAKSVAMERSLFERLQAQGCPVVLLTVQYRMHPEIRSFPSRHFYKDKLEDSPSVTQLPPESYHSQKYFRPYLVFDVARGKEKRSQGAGGSLSNPAEAELAACMYASLRSFLIEQHRKAINEYNKSENDGSPSKPPPPTPPKVSVAVITPYREQRAVLRDTFRSVCGTPDVLKEVAIETIDSYQGRQVDIVILSCVRAGASGGLGFVNDIRRLNVAITRARRSLWVLGAVATLKSNVEWAALIADAEDRGVVVQDAHAEKLFPELEYWQRKDTTNYTGGGGSGGSGNKKVKGKQKQQKNDDAGPSKTVSNDTKTAVRTEKEEEDGDEDAAVTEGEVVPRPSGGAPKPGVETSRGLAIARTGADRAGGRGSRGAGRGSGGGAGNAAAGRGSRGGKRERSLSPEPETAAEPSSRYPSMPTVR